MPKGFGAAEIIYARPVANFYNTARLDCAHNS